MSRVQTSGSVLRCGIIGAGQIGWKYDGGLWDGQRSVTHSACIARHPSTQLVMLCDPVQEARDAFSAAHPNVCTCATLDELLSEDLDVITIASSSEVHAAQILASFAAKAPRLFIEKPVTTRLQDYLDLLTRFENMPSRPRCVVNYFRRYLPQYQKLKEFVQSQENVTGISLTYSRRLDVNGVHLLDILGFLCDATTPPELEWIRAGTNGNPSFGLSIKGVAINVTGHDLPYHNIDVAVTAETGRLSVTRGGRDILWEPMEANPDFSGFFHLAPPEPLRPSNEMEQIAADMRDGTYLAFCNLLEDGPIQSSLGSAYFAQALMEQVVAAQALETS